MRVVARGIESISFNLKFTSSGNNSSCYFASDRCENGTYFAVIEATYLFATRRRLIDLFGIGFMVERALRT